MALAGIYPASNSQVRFEETSTTALFKPGDCILDNQGGLWMYVKASAAIAQYELVTITTAATPLSVGATTTTIGAMGLIPWKLGIAQVAFASGDYGWVWRGPGGGVGTGIKCKLAASCALDTQLWSTGTAGVVDDAEVDEQLIVGLSSTATITTAAAAEVVAVTFLIVGCQDHD